MTAPPGARPDAAADQAAHDVLAALYPSRMADLDAQLTGELAAIPDGQPKQDGIAVGAAAARQVVQLRAADGSAAAAGPVLAGDAARGLPSDPAQVRRRRCTPTGARSPRSCWTARSSSGRRPRPRWTAPSTPPP